VRELFAGVDSGLALHEIAAGLNARGVKSPEGSRWRASKISKLLRERGYRLGLLSNTWWAAEWHNADIAAHGLADLLDELVYTSDLPHSKPHPSVFAEIAARLGLEAAACVMIGDRQIDDVSGAKAVGMRAIWRRNDDGFPTSTVTPDAVVDRLSELPDLLRNWGGR